MKNSRAKLTFTGILYSVGVNRCLDVPPKISAALGGGKYIPVHATVDSSVFSSRLVPRGNGQHRLFVHSRIWKAMGVDSGDEITVTLTEDTTSVEIVLPDDIADAFGRDAEARVAFETMTVAGQQQFVRWINECRTKSTRARRIQTGMDRLLDNARKKKQRR